MNAAIRSTLPGTCTIACDVREDECDNVYAHAPVCRQEYIGHLEVALANALDRATLLEEQLRLAIASLRALAAHVSPDYAAVATTFAKLLEQKL